MWNSLMPYNMRSLCGRVVVDQGVWAFAFLFVSGPRLLWRCWFQHRGTAVWLGLCVDANPRQLMKQTLHTHRISGMQQMGVSLLHHVTLLVSPVSAKRLDHFCFHLKPLHSVSFCKWGSDPVMCTHDRWYDWREPSQSVHSGCVQS